MSTCFFHVGIRSAKAGQFTDPRALVIAPKTLGRTCSQAWKSGPSEPEGRYEARQYGLCGAPLVRAAAHRSSSRMPEPVIPRALCGLRRTSETGQHDHHLSGHVQVVPGNSRIDKRTGSEPDRAFRASRETGASNGGTGRIEAATCVEVTSKVRPDGSSGEGAGTRARPVAHVELQQRPAQRDLCRGRVEIDTTGRAPGLRPQGPRGAGDARPPMGLPAPVGRILLSRTAVREDRVPDRTGHIWAR